jgi:pseudouridine-5'-phosphate glycosidase
MSAPLLAGPYLHISEPVRAALDGGEPVVALESTVISHGLPYPVNLETAQRMEEIVREAGAVPATVGVMNGVLTVGLSEAQIELLATAQDIRKASLRDLAILAAHRQHGATTVAATALAAHRAGIRVFATGGTGGVHRGDVGDVSADLPAIASLPVAVVSAGAKAILDLPRTREWLETHGVPVLGYQTDEWPAFYSVSSGLPVDERVDTPLEAAKVLRAAWEMDLPVGVLIGVPPPAEVALPAEELEAAIGEALKAARTQAVTGKALTPFLLARVSELTKGRSLTVNVALLERNARVAAQISAAFLSL